MISRNGVSSPAYPYKPKIKTMSFKIDSYYVNEHTNDLVLYVGDSIFCTINCLNGRGEIVSEEEIEDIISDIEWEENIGKSEGWNDYLAK
jgi:hypothetical protein